jgi:hypothetical protein
MASGGHLDLGQVPCLNSSVGVESTHTINLTKLITKAGWGFVFGLLFDVDVEDPALVKFK